MNSKLVTDDVFFTNLNGDDKTLSDLIPGGEIKGATAFRGFIIDKNALDKDFLNIFTKVYVHVSWENSDKEHENKFLLIHAEPTHELMEYLNENQK